jgi:glutathione synthase/RimK-type ligase-like ATP-grasp enzyme
MNKNIKVLVIVGGGIKHISPVGDAANELGVDIVCASFSDLEYETTSGNVSVKVGGVDLAKFSVVYLRLVGKRFEDAALLVYYCRQRGVKMVDTIYESDGIIRIPIPKSIETKLLLDAGIPVPKTYFGTMKMIRKNAENLLGFPFVIKGTTGKQGHAVWSPVSYEELDKLVDEFTPKEKEGARFLAQEFTKASQRSRVFTIGDKAVAAITRPTRWRKRFLKKINGEFPEGKRGAIDPIPQKDAELAVKAAKAVKIDIGGVDIIHEDETGKPYVLEVNSAPRWVALKKDTGMFVEKEILKYLAGI